MRQTLFYIPHDIWGIPVFGIGWLLAIWGLTSAFVLWWLVRRNGWNADTGSQISVLAIMGAAIFGLPWIEETTLDGVPIGLPIRGYGVMLLAGVVAGLWLATYRARRMGVDPEQILSLAFWMFLTGIIGARLFYIIEFWDQFQYESIRDTLIAMINVTQGGLVVYGSFLGAVLAGAIYLRRMRIPVLAIADLIAPSLMLGVALGRVGCLLNGCCFGNVCDAPWAISFPRTSSQIVGASFSPPYESQLRSGQLNGTHIGNDPNGRAVILRVDPASTTARQGIAVGQRIQSVDGRSVFNAADFYELLARPGPHNVATLESAERRVVKWSVPAFPDRSRAVHPTQIYSSINALLLCLFLIAYYPFRRRDGSVFALLLTIYPVGRILLEALRADDQVALNLTISQIFSVFLLAAIAGLWLYILRQPHGSALPPALGQRDRLRT